jgi:hypothetical protein
VMMVRAGRAAGLRAIRQCCRIARQGGGHLRASAGPGASSVRTLGSGQHGRHPTAAVPRRGAVGDPAASCMV